jgi:alpha-L-fucosidase
MKYLATISLMLAITGTALAMDPATMPTVKDPKALKLPPADMQWWQDAKFGMFIHWGLYAIPAQGEWYMNDKKVPVAEYRKLMDQFNPQHYDPAAWAKAAKDGGMKYMVLTARHHDGFALWDSPASYDHFDAMHSAAKRDLIAPYVKAARDAGMRVGLYYSPMDWRFPGYFDVKGLPENAALLKKQAWGQIEELLTNYGPIDILWYDGAWLAMKGTDADAAPFWESDKLAQMARIFQPKIVISPRSGWIGDFGSDEGGATISGPIRSGPWERSINLNETTFGYNTQQRLMSRNRALTMLINAVVRDGNVLLNVGPDKDGVIPPTRVARLKEIGNWLGKYGESIYGTRPGPFEPVDRQYGATFRGKTIYMHVLSWAVPSGRGAAPAKAPSDTLVLPPLKQKITSARLLTADGAATFTQGDSQITLTLPIEKHDDLDTIIALDCDQDVKPQVAGQ